MDEALEFLGHDSVMTVPHIKKHMARQIYEDCGTYKINEVVGCFRELQTPKEVRDKVRRCCPNARGGQEIMRKDGTTYRVPHYNERAACALLDLLIEKGAWHGELMNQVRRMREKMRGGGHA